MEWSKHMRWTGMAGLALLLMLGAAACSPAPSGEEGAGYPAVEDPAPTEAADLSSQVPADTLVYATIGEPESLDPAWTYETTGAEVESNIYEGLVYFNRENPDDFVPALATEWTLSDDGVTYTFNVRDGVTFHAGGTLEPHDVAYSIQRALLQDRADGPMWLFLEPMFGSSSLTSLAVEKAGLEAAEGEEAPGLADVPAETLLEVCQMVQNAIVADDEAGTVTLTLAQPTPWMLQLLSQPWGSALDMEWMVEQGDWDGGCENWTQWNNPAAEASTLFDQANGTGPYKLVEWKKGESIGLAANEAYWRTEPIWAGGPSGPAAIPNIVMQKVPEWGTRFTKLQTGEADIVNVPRANIDQLANMVHTEYEGVDESAPSTLVNEAGTLKLFRGYPSVSNAAAVINHTINDVGGNEFIGSGQLDGQGIPTDFFQDIHVRKAFNYCFDWDTFIAEALLGEGIQVRGPIIEGLQGYSADSEVYSFDLQKCEEELTLAWDGQVAANGFQMTIAYNEGNEARKTAAEILASNLSAVDARYQLEVIKLEWPTFLDNMRQAKLPIGFVGWLEDYHDASNWVHPYMHSHGAYAGNQGFEPTMQAQFDALIDAGVVETDEAKRNEIYAQLQQLAIDNAIDIFLNQATGRAYMNKAVSGWFYNPLQPGFWWYGMSKAAAGS